MSLVLNVSRHFDDVISDGRLFQVLAAVMGNARSWKAVSVVRQVPRSMMNAGFVDQGVQRQAVERPPGRPAPVHGHTGTPARRICTLFAPVHEANADGKAAV